MSIQNEELVRAVVAKTYEQAADDLRDHLGKESASLPPDWRRAMESAVNYLANQRAHEIRSGADLGWLR